MTARLPIAAAALLAAAACLGPGCASIEDIGQVGGAIGAATGAITPEEAESIGRATAAVGRSFEEFTPEQEYFIGRAVAARLFSAYPAFSRPGSVRYLNLLGQALARASDLPETYAGYRFMILDSDEINAFAAPGGLILVTRGMLSLCQSEDEVAAVLAHEIGHVVHRHGLAAVQNSRVVSALTILAAEGARHLGGAEAAELADHLDGAVGDITQTLMVNGYARSQERAADQQAVLILRRIGYDPAALVRVLQAMTPQMKPGSAGFASTHPPPSTRIRDLAPLVAAGNAPAPNAQRTSRFAEAVGNL
jgi:predicted Zn-dependent protease